ncbi:hypothetical protein PKF022_03430 [Polynucleobacter sp. KF022]|nr:hypothetical protein PKF022_03430 [Polynucleobacter sp. KF022]
MPKIDAKPDNIIAKVNLEVPKKRKINNDEINAMFIAIGEINHTSRK